MSLELCLLNGPTLNDSRATVCFCWSQHEQKFNMPNIFCWECKCTYYQEWEWIFESEIKSPKWLLKL